MDHDENKDNTPRIRDYAAVVVVVGTAVYSAYGLGKLAVAWGKEGVLTLKERKNRQIEN